MKEDDCAYVVCILLLLLWNILFQSFFNGIRHSALSAHTNAMKKFMAFFICKECLMSHEKFMKLALEEAQKGCGWVSPNPLVGCVIVKNGDIIGRGYHKEYGDWHAERNALASCGQKPDGAVLYVTLEPCCHYGKTPPCTEAIIDSGITEVVVGLRDPNPLVSGKGIATLQEKGIRVTVGVLEEKCIQQNEVFLHFITKRTPFVAMKYAMTADGKTATVNGLSKWITGQTAREHVHLLRHRYAAIMVGVGTVIADDPMLTCRLPDCKNPVRVVCDTHLRIPLKSNIVKTAGEITTYIATCSRDTEKADRLRRAGCEMLQIPFAGEHTDLRALMAELGTRQLDGILLEGGAALHGSALKAGIVNKLYAYIAPKIFGGARALTAVGGSGVGSPDEAYRLENREITLLDDDVLLEYSLK